MKLMWHERVAWRRGPLGGLHAQWRDEEIPGASCCSESAALSGPDEGYSNGACRACVALALSLVPQTQATCSAEPRPVARPVKMFDWRAAREESVRRVALLREMEAKGLTITARGAAEAWGTSNAAAHMALRKLRQRGAVERVGYGLFRVAETAAPEVTP